jgi:hypothetical protein
MNKKRKILLVSAGVALVPSLVFWYIYDTYSSLTLDQISQSMITNNGRKGANSSNQNWSKAN